MATWCNQIASVFVVILVWSTVDGQYNNYIRPKLLTTASNGVVHCKEGSEVVVSCHDASSAHYDVRWERADRQPLPPDVVTHGGELCFTSVRSHDAGQYVCRATSYPRLSSRRCRREVTVMVDRGNQFCGTGQWCCGNGQCVDESCHCDGNVDCEDGTDEECPRPPRIGGNCKWARWSRCTADCKQYRNEVCYDVTTDGVRVRKKVMSTIYRDCQGDLCSYPVAPKMCQWSEWSDCSEPCGPGIRTRSCLPSHNPMALHYAQRRMNPEVTHCQVKPCPVDGGWSEWTLWGPCTDNGRTRTRACNNPPPMDGGRNCVGPSEETSICFICSSSLSMHLSPHSFTKHHLGDNVTFECGYCGNPIEKIRIDLDTSPSSRSKGLVHSVRRHISKGNCSSKLWSVRLTTGVDYVKCSLKDGRKNVLGSLASKLKIIGENDTCDAEREFCCANGNCIPQIQRCNGQDDCSDKSDEVNCNRCSVDAFQCASLDKCIPDSERCDETVQCPDGSDERNCDVINRQNTEDDERHILDDSANIENPSYGRPLSRPRKHTWETR